MSDNQAPEAPEALPEGGEQQQPGPGQGDGDQGPVPYDRFQQVIQERNQTRQKLQELEQAQRKAEEEAAKEQGKWRELYEATQPKAELLESYETAVQEMLEGRLGQVPEHLRGLVPQGSPLEQLQWLERAAAAGVFGQEPAPRGPGVPPSGPRQPPTPTITRDQMMDPVWVREHKDEIRAAAKEGRLEQ